MIGCRVNTQSCLCTAIIFTPKRLDPFHFPLGFAASCSCSIIPKRFLSFSQKTPTKPNAKPKANGVLCKSEDFLVINFYHFVFIDDPHAEVSNHLSFLQGLDIHGRIYLNEQGINAQYSGPSKDALAYVEWLREDERFSDILVQVSPAVNGHAFPKLKLRYKPSLVQFEGGVDQLPLLDPSMRATRLSPSEWRKRLEEVNTADDSSNENYILLDVRNDPLADVDKEKTDILMYCTGGIRCDVYSTILRQRGFQNLFSLEGGVSHYLKNEGPVKWTGNLFVFDSRLSLPPSSCKPEAVVEATKNQEVSKNNAFARCYICGSQVCELRHRNCANLDCNLLFLCCTDCVKELRGCCCPNCTTAPRLRPVLPGHQRYQKWHIYRDSELHSKLPS
ncbi:rhodanese-like domain-containing protein 8, chloroplastic isoform X2 [Morus notabilis]|uniref:rhodanese-like domain-containing protein 8, chloroplastic isoform X2 n=1 Tax=Morus notabilis TaxID=981085 RepID=UPI000CED602E|nr:rhodanese-like domain-containing protein 8, chloroplastic isoform X2 [Morus notabilis]